MNMEDLQIQMEILKDNLQKTEDAYKSLFRHLESDRQIFKDSLIHNIKLSIEPYLQKLKDTNLSETQMQYLSIIENNLEDVISPLDKHITVNFFQLTPMEIQIANLIKIGKTTKEIADLLHLSEKTISTHRNNIRKKLGLKHTKVPLRSYLLNTEELSS